MHLLGVSMDKEEALYHHIIIAPHGRSQSDGSLFMLYKG
jgi:hypothetical protein